MNEEQYLSTKEVWFGHSPQIQAFDNERLIIVEAGSETEARLYVDAPADPNSADAGKVCVKVMSFVPPIEMEWTDAGSGKPSPPTVSPHPWQRFLTQHALNLIKRDENGDFSLTLSSS
jgi:hypothetical protein